MQMMWLLGQILLHHGSDGNEDESSSIYMMKAIHISNTIIRNSTNIETTTITEKSTKYLFLVYIITIIVEVMIVIT